MSSSSPIKKISLIFSYCVLFFIVLEMTLRILGLFLSQRPALGSLEEGNFFNIVCIGDSFTYGWGVETTDTYPSQLEKMLNNNSSHGKKYRVFNLAIPGSNSSQHLHLLQQILAKYSAPNLVIVLTGANDAWNLAYSNVKKVLDKDNKTGFHLLDLKIALSDLRIYKMAKLIVINLRGVPHQPEADVFSQVRRSQAIATDTLKKLQEYNLSSIIRLALTYKAKVIVQNYPRGDLYGEHIAEKVALRFDVPFVDNAASFKETLKTRSFRELFVYDNSHPNKEGYSIIADNLYHVIVSQIEK